MSVTSQSQPQPPQPEPSRPQPLNKKPFMHLRNETNHYIQTAHTYLLYIDHIL